MNSTRQPETKEQKPLIAIHNSTRGFHPRWIDYCERRAIPYRLVNCHSSDIVQQVGGCQALMWHHSQSDPRDVLIARPILSALEHAGMSVFPDFRTAWHFDDKVAQKYLFEALGIPAVPAHVLVDRSEALRWVDQAEFPKVFKLRRGAGSAGVCLVKTRGQARQLVRRAFARGFALYSPLENLKERIYKVRLGKLPTTEIFKAVGRFFYPPRYSRILGRERGYVYFQDFLPGNRSDTRVFVVGEKACALRRSTRPGDFRASGSGLLSYDPESIHLECIRSAFKVQSRLKAAAAAFDYIFDEHGKPLIIEMSYGSPTTFYDGCPGYWDRALNWHEAEVDPQGWMVESVMTRNLNTEPEAS